MLVLYTDYGLASPYVGQLKAVLAREAPGVTAIDLLHEAPAFSPRAAAYLLATLAPEFPEGAVFVCVVDPGVGTDRRPLTLHADGRWYVGPDNGLLNAVARRAKHCTWYEITWRPERLSATFHGRDLFAPVAAQLARGAVPQGCVCAPPESLDDWPADLPEVVYLDPYGNAMTGLRAQIVGGDVVLRANERCFQPARTFADAPPGAAIWYPNSSGAAELAINQGNAAASCGLKVGTKVSVQPECD
jgi:S-adenosyl-L-methionine hydrolase (adenosine-forming)